MKKRALKQLTTAPGKKAAQEKWREESTKKAEIVVCYHRLKHR
jgi:hypothetical protein